MSNCDLTPQGKADLFNWEKKNLLTLSIAEKKKSKMQLKLNISNGNKLLFGKILLHDPKSNRII